MQDLKGEVSDKYSLHGRVFNRLREDIISGKYKENEELRESTIAGELGVSRTPVREAIKQLELEGLVNVIPNKGAYVTGISEKDIRDIYVIRSYLEGLCARWACEKQTDDLILKLSEVVDLTDFYIEKGNTDQILELDDRFHELLYQASGSKRLYTLLSDFHHYVKPIRQQSLSRISRAKESNAEHRAIVEAFKKGDEEEAERLAHEHIIRTISSHIMRGL
jgi:DNA-binding GntR family transcriptional regulator